MTYLPAIAARYPSGQGSRVEKIILISKVKVLIFFIFNFTAILCNVSIHVSVSGQWFR